MNARERWEELQQRWAQGESLSPAEEQERLDYAAHDPRARRELEAFAALRAYAKAEGEPLSAALIDGVLEAVADGARLRAVTERELRVQPAIPSRRMGAWFVAAASLALAAALGTFALASPGTPKRLATSGPSVAQAVAARFSYAELVLTAGEVLVDGKVRRVDRRALRAGAMLTTGDGRACFTVEPAIDVCLAERTTVLLEALAAPSVRIRVDDGLALASLSRRRPGSSFALLAGDLSATARGTIFSARRERDEAEITVVEGNVQVARGGVSSQVGTRVRVRTGRGGALRREPIAADDEARLLRLRPGHALAITAALGFLELDSKVPGTSVSVDAGPRFPLPLQTRIGAGRHLLSWHDATGQRLESWVDVAAGESQRSSAPLGRTAEVAPNLALEKPSAASLLDAARSELGRANPRAALALYEKLRASYPASSEAHTVLPTVGRLRLDLGDAVAALRAFDAYLARPGTLAPEALSGRIRALRALGQRSSERAAIAQYLARYPKGLERPLLERRLAELGGP